jgi:hypothetical protein
MMEAPGSSEQLPGATVPTSFNADLSSLIAPASFLLDVGIPSKHYIGSGDDLIAASAGNDERLTAHAVEVAVVSGEGHYRIRSETAASG